MPADVINHVNKMARRNQAQRDIAFYYRDGLTPVANLANDDYAELAGVNENEHVDDDDNDDSSWDPDEDDDHDSSDSDSSSDDDDSNDDAESISQVENDNHEDDSNQTDPDHGPDNGPTPDEVLSEFTQDVPVSPEPEANELPPDQIFCDRQPSKKKWITCTAREHAMD